MAKYNYYIAKSLLSLSNPNGEVGFHLRIALDSDNDTAPFLDYDSDWQNPVNVERSVTGDVINYLVTVWLMETNTPKDLIYKDWIFSEPLLNFDKIFGKIIVHKKLLSGKVETEETGDNLIHDPMPAEYPVD